MQRSHFTKSITTTFIGILVLLLGATVVVAQQQVNLTAGPTSLTLPDGSIVPMWGYTCGAVVAGSTATCKALNPAVAAGGWSPVVITVPTGQPLRISLTNQLTFTPVGATANTIPTSIVIAGQLGGGLGGTPVRTSSPAHENLSTTWPIANTGPVFVPPTQPGRVQSFATEVTVAGGTTALDWTAPRPGTYLLESGTHPSIQVPMGLYGMVVVTAAPSGTNAGTAYPGVSYNADVPLLFSEIDPTQNKSVTAAVNTAGFSESATLGPYSAQPLTSLNLLNPGHGYTQATTTVQLSGGGCSTSSCAASVAPIVDTDPTSPTYQQITGFNITSGGSYTSAPSVTIVGNCVATTGNPCASADAALQLATSATCSGGASACYPPAVNYTPFYYLINGQAFDKTNPGHSLFAAAPATGVTGSVLVRMVNAGLRMHVPSIVGAQAGTSASGFALIAEDGNPLPGVPRVQNEVFMAAGKTYDVRINVPAAGGTALPVYDRELSLSANATARDAGMLAYISINNALLPTTGQFASTATGAVARPDSYPSLVAGRTFSVSDPSKGVIANDTNVLGVKVLTPPLNGLVTLNSNGTFTYVPAANGIQLSLTGGGSGYSAPAVVNISAPPSGGTQATATATVGASGVTGITVGSGGSGYTSPTVAIDPPPAGGTQAVATATLASGISLSLGSAGAGYISPSVAISAPDVATGTQATATATADPSTGAITAITVTDPGSGYINLPTVSITDSGTPAGTGATATVAFAPGTGVINAITVTTPGAGYTTVPNVTITDSTGGSGASATASLSATAGTITAIKVTYIGSGYTSLPTVTITGGSGTGATVSVTAVPGNATSDTFIYQANGNGPTAMVTLGAATIESASFISCASPISYTASNATHIAIGTPGVLAGCTDAAGYPLTVDTTTVAVPTGSTLAVVPDANGGFAATAPGAGAYSFTFVPVNSQGTHASAAVTVNLTFPTGSGLTVTVVDGVDKSPISDYRWIIEEDRTFYVDPNCTANPLPAGCPTVTSQGAPAVFGTNFHTSFMPVVATGCTGTLSCEGGQTLGGSPVVCDVGNGVCRPGSQQTPVDPSQVHLDPTKRYYISVLPGDAANPFNAGYAGAPDCSTAGKAAGSCGHGMGGAPVVAPCFAAKSCVSTSQFGPVQVLSQPSPYPPAKLTVFVFEDDWPLNGEHDAGGGVDILSPQEPGLGGFQITLFDDAGGTGDATGTPTYDMFNMPLTNSLAGSIDPVTGLDACPISTQDTANATTGDGSQKGIVGMIVTCPTFESDGVTMSPLAGQAVVNNLYQGRYGVMATPAADRIARGEEWLQTNTLDGQKAHDSFMRIGEPAYFQEFGPAGYHVTIGFANPTIINERKSNGLGSGLCDAAPNGGGLSCTNEVKGHNTTARMTRPPDERLYGSGSRDSFAFTQCYASLGDPDGADFAFVKCDADGNFDFTNVPAGNWKLTLFDQWNDQIVDGISTPIGLAGQSGATLDLGEVATHQWQTNIYTRSFIDTNRDGVSTKDKTGVPCTAPNTPAGCNPNYGNDVEGGLALVSTNIRFRDGSFSNFNNTDLNGYAGFNEVFPLFNWYTIETDSTRYKTTGVHVVYDAGGPTDGTAGGGSSTIAQFYANTTEAVPLPSAPTNLRIPGAVYCDATTATADCAGLSIATGPVSGGSGGPICTWSSGGTVSCSSAMSTGRIDPPFWFGSYGWQGFSGQNSFLEFGKVPYADNENGGIRGHVIYASTRPFDDPRLLLQTSWEPLVPHVRINLYEETTAPDGTQGLKLIDHTETSSFDDWAQGFRSDGVPNMNCPGQSASDLFFFGLENQPNYLDYYNNVAHGTATSATALPYSSQFKCYDGMHNWNQLQPAPYDGMYSFPSVTSFNPTTGKPAGTNCTDCTTNPDTKDPYRFGTPMLKPGKYVVEVVVPPGYELVKEEDKNILIGDNYIAPVTQQFAGLGNIFILPDQAAVDGTFNSANPQNATTDLGRTTLPSTESDTGSVEQFWPCVGAARIVPDFMSIFPQSAEVAPFAGATRNLCDRKEVTVENQASALAKFYIFTSTHVASHFTGVITDDFTAEFDPFSPQFGEKFAPAYLPVSVKDWAGNEVSRVYADEFGAYTGLNYSTWEVNPPNPTGYGPTMMVTCMNDAGTGPTPDPLFQPNYSQFCYELPFMPGQTGYFDTPVVPTSSFSEGYNHPDCNYPDATPAIASVTSQDIAGPWVSNSGHTLTITALGDQMVDNYGYTGPSITTTPFNLQKVKRHYGFGTCSPAGGVCTNGASITIGGRAAAIQSWIDSQIVVSVPSNVPVCSVQQQIQYQGTLPSNQPRNTRCGQLLITNANGQQSIDTVTVTVGGKTPTLLTAGQKIQPAIDAALPGDMIIVPPGAYNELLIMWKPIRLQGVGAVSSIINANTHPAGKMEPWRQQIVCLFGLTLDGRPSSGPYAGCPGAGWNPSSLPGANASFPTMIVDRVTMEAVLGWDASLNGNLAEQLIEPSLMGAYEGAAITVLGKGVNIPANATDPFGSSAAAVAAFPAGTVLLTASDCGNTNGHNPYPSNFYCNPSSIDGLTLSNSSQGGGGIFVHAWGHNIQIANNRVKNNQGTLSGGITVGQGEHVDVQLAGSAPLNDPASCETSRVTNQGLPFCYNMNVNVHNNSVTLNSSLGDELFSSTPAGAGGVTFCNGSDYYQFNYNWICGNMSTGDGGGVAHLGYSKNGDIEHNSILFNQSTNPTITTNGGGLLVMGAPDLDPTCGATTDKDCVPDPATVTPSDGTGPRLVINANLILGNAADSGSGGGLRMQHVNGTDVINFPNGSSACPNVANGNCLWNSVNVTNNIITNNVAGWDGGGVSLLDSLAVNIVNNTIVSNDSTASSGVLFGSLFAPLASAPGTNCTANNGAQSCPQVAGLVSDTNSPILKANLPATGFSCPPGHGAGASCRDFSDPLLDNDVIWQNRSFFIGVTAPTGTGTTGQQSSVALFNSFTTTAAGSQGTTGACPTASYWEIGVRGDQTVAGHESGFQFAPTYSVLTDAGDYPGANNLGSNPALVSQYCNGSRVPPELGSMGYTVNPGTNETNALPSPVFTLTPSATVDEGNNWINLRWGPLSLTQPVTGVVLGNYAPAAGSPVINQVPSGTNAYTVAPATDFFGRPRKTAAAGSVDIGAVEVQGVSAPTLASVVPNAGFLGNNYPVTLTGTGFTNTMTVAVSGTGVTVSNVVFVSSTSATATFSIAANAPANARNVTVTVPGNGTSNSVTFNVQTPPTPTLTLIAPNTGARGTSVAVTLTGSNFTTTGTTVNVSGVGVTATGVTVVSATQITANFVITGSAGLGNHGVSVTTPGGTSTPTVPFSVTGPTLTSINPASAPRGSVVNVTITGTGLTGATSVSISGTGVTVSNFAAVNATTVTATFTIASNASSGAGSGLRTVTVTTPNGSPTITFRVTAATLTISAPVPPLCSNAGGTGGCSVGAANTTTKSGTITVTNTASGTTSGPFTFTSAPTVTKTAGAVASSFSITGGTCANGGVVNPGSNCTIVVQYSPGGVTTTATAHVTVTGSGINPATQNGGNFNGN
jgi:hypothetical protein